MLVQYKHIITIDQPLTSNNLECHKSGMKLHSKKKSTSDRAPFLVLQVVTNMVLPGTVWSFQVLNRVLYL